MLQKTDIFKQFVQVSGLCGPQFLSYLLKLFRAPLWSGHVETQTMQTADCADHADCADCAD